MARCLVGLGAVEYLLQAFQQKSRGVPLSLVRVELRVNASTSLPKRSEVDDHLVIHINVRVTTVKSIFNYSISSLGNHAHTGVRST